MLNEWAKRWNLPPQAIRELQAALTVPQPVATSNDGEAMVQSKVRLRVAQEGWAVWRNNVGVLKNERGQPIRYGLANDSSKLNAAIKSADLIGLRPVTITADMVGSTIGQFVSLEVKPAGWTYRHTEREQAQARWAEIITAHGGHAKFITSEEQL